MSSQRSMQADVSAALVPAIILFGGMVLLLIGLLASRPNAIPAKSIEVTAPSVLANATKAPQVVAVMLDPAQVKAGENSFQTTCAACHSFNGMGIPGLGKPLVRSQFVNSQTDDQLLSFLQVGRAVTDPLNTTGVLMPARGGNPNFTDDKLVEIITYIRSLNAVANQAVPGVAPTSSAPVTTSVIAEFTPLNLSGLVVPTVISGSAGSTNGSESIAALRGESLYVKTCSGCHAADGSGVQYIAKPLAESAVLQSKNGIGLLNFLIEGDPTLSPPHPYRGGYPELSDADLLSIIVYLYSLPTGK